MAKAVWNDVVIAESDACVLLEGNHYFPKDSVKEEFLEASETKSTCPWKGEASYYSLVVNGKTNQDSAWYYPEPSDAAKQVSDHIAFWRGVTITQD